MNKVTLDFILNYKNQEEINSYIYADIRTLLIDVKAHIKVNGHYVSEFNEIENLQKYYIDVKNKKIWTFRIYALNSNTFNTFNHCLEKLNKIIEISEPNVDDYVARYLELESFQ